MPELMPNYKEVKFKEEFIERYSKLTNFEVFKKYSLSFPRKSIRVNTLKTSVKEVKKKLEKNWLLEQIPWCKQGFWVKHKKGRLDIGNTKEHFLGYIYVQDAASMIPPIVLNPKPNDVVLDMCASPGSKTTQISALMKNKGLLIANDYKAIRIPPLSINLQRAGATNAIITLMEGRFFKQIFFDKILVDAPCSGTGTVRKSLKTLRIWNPNMVKRLAGTQRQLIETAFNILKLNGTLVYSTCSLEPEENEGVIDFLLKKYKNAKIEKISLNIKTSNPILEFEKKSYNKEIKNCLRIWPQDNDTEGFFIACIKKC